MAQNRNGMMSSAPNLVQALRPGGVQNAMRVFSPEEQQSVAQQMFAGGPGARMPQFGMRNPPFYNPPPGQNMQMEGGFMQNMINNNAQGSIQDFLAGGGQGGVPPEAYQNYSQQPQPQQQQAQPQKGGANAGRVRQSPGVYKDPRTGALYGNNGKLMRAGTGRMR